MGWQLDLNSIGIVVTGIALIIIQVWNTIKMKNKDMKTEIIKDYETRLGQVTADVAQLRQDNTTLTAQLQALRDLPLKQIADGLGVMVKSQALLADTQQQIIGLLMKDITGVSIKT